MAKYIKQWLKFLSKYFANTFSRKEIKRCVKYRKVRNG